MPLIALTSFTGATGRNFTGKSAGCLTCSSSVPIRVTSPSASASVSIPPQFRQLVWAWRVGTE